MKILTPTEVTELLLIQTQLNEATGGVLNSLINRIKALEVQK